MADDKSCTEETLYSGLSPSIVSHGSKLGLQARSMRQTDVVKSYLKRHLPANRLMANEDNISRRQVHLSRTVKKKKFDLTSQKKKKLTNRERKGMKVFKIPKENQSYSQQLPLHQAWKQYMEEVIPSSSVSSPGAVQAACQKVVKAELQGGMLTVQRSKCPSYVGVCGIVMQETRHTFTFITSSDKVKCVPKENSIFALELHGHIFTIHGSHFKVKAGERSSKKFKSKPTTDL
ncbi:ribonuclease P protein subunit p29-like [Littorina saxatilis]|uniref:Ribonuclease P protein subunit p29 n=1 Tax=Littorina saxatilis TaxID=31220 RepID=A0AAN9BZZ9_9CAEN